MVAAMTEALTKIEWLLGSVDLGQPTNRWHQDADGGWWNEWTPRRTLDHYGRVISTEPNEPLIKMYGVDPKYIMLAGGVIATRQPDEPAPHCPGMIERLVGLFRRGASR